MPNALADRDEQKKKSDAQSSRSERVSRGGQEGVFVVWTYGGERDWASLLIRGDVAVESTGVKEIAC
jgi:hypothetical protein